MLPHSSSELHPLLQCACSGWLPACFYGMHEHGPLALWSDLCCRRAVPHGMLGAATRDGRVEGSLGAVGRRMCCSCPSAAGAPGAQCRLTDKRTSGSMLCIGSVCRPCGRCGWWVEGCFVVAFGVLPTWLRL
jgi:hypothetical protein